MVLEEGKRPSSSIQALVEKRPLPQDAEKCTSARQLSGIISGFPCDPRLLLRLLVGALRRRVLVVCFSR